LNVDERHQFVSRLAATHGERLRRYLATRLRYAKGDVPDLAQEVFLRLWRVNRPETILNPEAYLFTIANHVLHQYALKRIAAGEIMDLRDPLEGADVADPALEAEMQQRLQELECALGQLSYKAQAALILYRRDGFSLEEVASRLNISVSMVKKYLAKAILHCRQYMPAEK
jgi:RNA polymerase sigma factor (sigma-70 family)